MLVRKRLSAAVAVFALHAASNVYADNPMTRDPGINDAHVHIFGDMAYAFVAHDFDPQAKNWDLRDWPVYASSDLVHWSLKFTLRPKDTYVRPDTKRCFATDGATRNGKYYLYFSDAQASTGVARADAPAGPYVDALKHPMVTKYDPTPFIDDDATRTPYLVWGAIQFRIAKLNEDMISLAEPERKLEMEHWAKKSDGSFLHKKNGVYYLTSNLGHYGTSKNIYGPYTYAGRFTPYGKGDDVDHPTFFTWHGQDYFCGSELSFYRTVRMTYVHYRRDGGIVVDPVIYGSKLGIGQYDAAAGKVEAEWYFKIEGQATKAERPGGRFGIENIHDRDALYFPNVMNLARQAKLSFRASAVNGGRIEVRDGTPAGELLSTCTIPANRTTDDQVYSGVFNSPKDKCDLCLVFRGGDGELLRLDSFTFSQE